jgi:hypothetical protein
VPSRTWHYAARLDPSDQGLAPSALALFRCLIIPACACPVDGFAGQVLRNSLLNWASVCGIMGVQTTAYLGMHDRSTVLNVCSPHSF